MPSSGKTGSKRSHAMSKVSRMLVCYSHSKYTQHIKNNHTNFLTHKHFHTLMARRWLSPRNKAVTNTGRLSLSFYIVLTTVRAKDFFCENQQKETLRKKIELTYLHWSMFTIEALHQVHVGHHENIHHCPLSIHFEYFKCPLMTKQLIPGSY